MGAAGAEGCLCPDGGRGVRPPSPDCVGAITATGGNSIRPWPSLELARSFALAYAGSRNGKAAKCGGFPMEWTGIEPVTPACKSDPVRPHGLHAVPIRRKQADSPAAALRAPAAPGRRERFPFGFKARAVGV